MQRFEGQSAIVTGAAGSIGAATARRLVAEGARVALVDCSAEALSALAAELGSAASRHVVDVADASAVEAVVADVASTHGGIDVLCNNAGTAGNDYSGITDTDMATWQRLLAVNLMGSVAFTRYAGAVMTHAGHGTIVNTASVAGIRSGAGGNAYSASKAAIINLTQTSACDLGTHGIRVNAVCPGLVRSNMTQPVFDYAEAQGKSHKLGGRCELKRPGEPEEIAAAICFLASSDASFITGQALPVDGGNTASLNMPGMKV
ncbi:MAG: oxidoreductase [Xanthomonadales bacterium]|nr:oxidoreductase [Xanthomonadales bacterium]